MKVLVLLLSLAVFGYWVAMNTFVMLRQREFAELSRYRQGVTKFLGGELLRERWMGVYKDHKKIGYTGFSMEKVRPVEGVEFHSTVETFLTFDLFGRGQRLRLNARLVQDEELRPLRLQGNVSIDDKFDVRLSGERREDRFHLGVKAGETKILELPLPLEDLFLGDGLVPSIPMTGFTPGETFRMPCFDPLAMARDVATVKVLREETAEVDGVAVDCFVLETTFHGASSTSYVTRDGEVLVQRFGPPLDGIALKKESRDRAMRGLPR